MLNELDSRKSKSRKRCDHIQESNIIVSTPVFDQCVSEFSMKMKLTQTFKEQQLKIITEKEKAAKAKQKSVGRGGGGAAPPAGSTPVVEHQEVGVKHLLQPSLQVCLGSSRIAASTTPSLLWPLPQSSLQRLPKRNHLLMIVIMTVIQIMIMKMTGSTARKILIWMNIKKVLEKPLISSCLPNSSKRNLLSQVSPRYSGTLPNQEVPEEH